MVRHVWDRISATASSARERVAAVTSAVGERIAAAAVSVSDAAGRAWSKLDGWDRLVLIATTQLLVGMILVFGVGVALVVHGALWLIIAGAGARGAEIGELLEARRARAGG